MTVRPSLPSAAAAIAAIEAQIFSDPWTEEDVRSTVEASYTLCFTAEDGGEIVGYVLTTSIPPEGEIRRIAVRRDKRRQGYGRRLLDVYLTAANERGVHTVFLEVRKQNAPAQALYQSFGFQATGLRRAYYRHPTDDACLMCYTR